VTAASQQSLHTPLASIIVVATNERHHLVDLLPSVAAQTYPTFEVLIVDNGSTDGTPEYVELNFPTFRVVRNAANLGYLRANNRGFDAARGDVLVVLNPDTQVELDWLAELVATLERHPEAGLATSRILMYYERDQINACGNDIHVTGLAFCRGLGRPRRSYEDEKPVAAISGCSFAIRRSVLEAIGPFDESLNPYLEDTDLSWRARLAGYSILYAPRSIVYHKYALRMRPQKFAYLEENRHIVLAKTLRWRTLLVLAPALLLAELMIWSFAILRGRAYLAAKCRAYWRLLSAWPDVLRRRQRMQALRRVEDKDLLPLLSVRIPLDELLGSTGTASVLGTFANAWFALVVAIARLLVR
jgi:GT2 family glycosyltransferase